MDKIIVITGPTASGKTSLAIELAKRKNGEIINADSVIFYKHLNIGGAKPSIEEQENIKHHLIDIFPLEKHFTAFDFISLADDSIKKIIQKNKIPIISGGSPLYIKALLEGLFELPEIPENIRDNVKKRFETAADGEMFEYLKKIDPDAAARIHYNDKFRIGRAVEVFEATGFQLSALQKKHNFQQKRYKYIKLAIDYPREILYQRINQRVDLMLEKGLIKEVKDLFEQGYHPDNYKSMRAIGYPEIIKYLEKKITIEEAVELLKQHTRQFAKRQLTWLRKEEDIYWLKPGSALEDGLRLVESFEVT